MSNPQDNATVVWVCIAAAFWIGVFGWLIS